MESIWVIIAAIWRRFLYENLKAAAFYGKDSFLVEMEEAATDGQDHVDRVLERDALEQRRKEVLIWST